MKKLFLFLGLVLWSIQASAQETNDVIYLNNGNIVKGEIVASGDSTVQIRTANGDLHTFDRVTIRKIDQGQQLEAWPKAPKSRYKDLSDQSKGFWAGVDLMFGANVEHEFGISGSMPLDLQVTFGYRFNEYLQVGAGAGFRYYFNNDQARAYVNSEGKYEDYGWSFPVYGQLRGLFFSGQSRTTVPFWQMSVGHTFNDGFMLSPALGLRFGSTERNHFTLGLHYTAQWTWLRTNLEGGPSREFGPMHLLQLRLGYQF